MRHPLWRSVQRDHQLIDVTTLVTEDHVEGLLAHSRTFGYFRDVETARQDLETIAEHMVDSGDQ
ncbi:hypothetical protein BBK82_08210 [Lentzea guizhouensis]|uniref:Uncharacterized protein n=1 Tax=Lentzea guizhouensis TaxID=1586287 RepID=A0A1B2HE94_9PSEU|nr:hypothetical protein BBK82_08210 [Lentzea guizhouensis]